MHALAIGILPLLLQVKVDATAKRDSGDAGRRNVNVEVKVRSDDGDSRREPRRIPVTAEHLRTAFRSPLARTLLERARAARLAQDSALMSYEATAYMRLSAGLGFSRIGRDRLIFRTENVTNVKWHRHVGAWVDVKGARTALPGIPAEGQREAESEIIDEAEVFQLPYYPGQEPLLSLNGAEGIKTQVDERDMVHPLAEGAEAYYTYAVGDSVVFRLPDGTSVQLRELLVRPRQPKWNVAVGSLWFDIRSGQLVRAAYRLAVPMDIWAIVEEEDPTAQDEIPVWVKPLITPMRAQVSAIAVEYGMYQGRFWLPRLRSAEGDAQVSFMRVPFRLEQSYRYASVNALASLPEIRLPQRARPPDSLSEADRDKWRDSVREVRRAQRRALEDSIRDGLRLRPSRCDSMDVRTVTRRASDESGMAVAVRIPCDIRKLATSPDLPKSIFDEGEEIFGSAERNALIREALVMGAQPPFAIGAVPPTIKYGLEYTRFNRIEGLSSGLMVEQKLGAGYTASLFGRIGHADLEPNAELTLSRSNLSRTLRGRAYNRLVAANDWGSPLGFGSSLSALLFGRDEGFYYRATGVELEMLREQGSYLSTRLFLERQRNAAVENHFSLGPPFIPNIAAASGSYAGFSTRALYTHGLDPDGFRFFSDVRIEGAVGDTSTAAYARAAADVTLTQGFGGYAGALTISGGGSAGDLPLQRRWYLGGAHTVRGQRADTAQSGDAYWLGRVELGRAVQGVKPVIFGDIGWVGERSRWREVGRPLSGAGVGASVLDGLVRFDVSRGIHPHTRLRIDMYVEARF